MILMMSKGLYIVFTLSCEIFSLDVKIVVFLFTWKKRSKDLAFCINASELLLEKNRPICHMILESGRYNPCNPLIQNFADHSYKLNNFSEPHL